MKRISLVLLLAIILSTFPVTQESHAQTTQPLASPFLP